MKDFSKKIEKYLKDRNWDSLRPGDVSKSISIEAAELLEIFQWDNPELQDAKKDKERLEKVRKELADIMIYCFDLAVLLKIDIKKTLLEKLAYIEKKYPTKLFNKNTRAGDPGTEAAYWKIKGEYRKKGK